MMNRGGFVDESSAGLGKAITLILVISFKDNTSHIITYLAFALKIIIAVE